MSYFIGGSEDCAYMSRYDYVTLDYHGDEYFLHEESCDRLLSILCERPYGRYLYRIINAVG